MRYAHIRNGIVDNISLVADEEDQGDPIHGAAFLADLFGGDPSDWLASDDAQIGWLHDGETLTAPPINVAEQIALRESQIAMLQAEIEVLQATSPAV